MQIFAYLENWDLESMAVETIIFSAVAHEWESYERIFVKRPPFSWVE